MSGYLEELQEKLDAMNATDLLKRLRSYRWTGRPGYPLKAMWRVYASLFLLGLGNINDLYRKLRDQPEFREFCGLKTLPRRTTINKFILRLTHHSDLVMAMFSQVTERLKDKYPDLGKEVAIDGTFVKAYANPNRSPHVDPDARWGYKNSARSKNGKQVLDYGYKMNLVADIKYELPLVFLTLPANASEMTILPTVIAYAESVYPWFHPDVLVADKGFDSLQNHQYLIDKDILPIIHIRKPPKGGLYEGIYTENGVPTCIGRVPMQYVRSDPEKGWLYRCGGCHLKESFKGAVRYCDTEVWEDPTTNPRLFGAIRRESPEWKALYAKRQAVERVFKSLKQSRRLEKHSARNIEQVRLHVLMSVLTYQVTALVNVLNGRIDEMGWMVKRVP